MATWHGLFGLYLLGCLGCSARSEPAPAVVLRISPLTAERLDQAFRALPDIIPKTVPAEGSIAGVRALQAKEVDLAIVMADTAYHAYVDQSQRDPSLFAPIRGIAVLNVNTLYLAAAPHTPIRSMADLRGHRVGLGSSGSATTAITTLLLRSSGIGVEGVRGEFGPSQDTLKQLSNGTLDAAFLSLNASVHAAAAAGVRLIPISGAWIEDLRQQYPFLQTVLVPAKTYPGQNEPLHTVGVDLVLACRGDLDHDLVYRLSKAYFEALQRSAPTTDFERAPATPIPLHAGAARYYRERALSR